MGLVGNAADLMPRLLADSVAADIVTDQTSAHDPLNYVPNELVASGKIKAPIVIGRDHLDSGSVASPYRETEEAADGGDLTAQKLERVLLNDPGTGVMRHANGAGLATNQIGETARIVVIEVNDNPRYP